jgi:hypothetical protein
MSSHVAHSRASHQAQFSLLKGSGTVSIFSPAFPASLCIVTTASLYRLIWIID